MSAALVGALVGAGITALAGLATWALGEWSSSLRIARQARADLAREIIRHRGDQALVAGALNELPILFGHDDAVMRSYRQFFGGDADSKTAALTDIVIRMAGFLGVKKSVNTSDLQRYLYVDPLRG